MTPRRTEDRILLVDDLALVRRTVPARIGALGCKVAAVSSASEALEWLEKHRADLILLDVVLPGKDGLVFCRELKSDPRYRTIPVVIFTDVGGNIFERSMEAGADDCVPKRAHDAFLRIRIHLHLHLAELRRLQQTVPDGPVDVLLATNSSLLRAQLPPQLVVEGHRPRLAVSLANALDSLTGEERLMILDMALDPEGVHGFLSQLRMDPEKARLPVLLLCDKNDMERLTGLEFMLDDVLVKPLAAHTNRLRLRLLLELGRRLAK